LIQTECHTTAVTMTVVRARVRRASTMTSIQDINLSVAVNVDKGYYNVAVSDSVKHDVSTWYLRVVAE
jgi:hypothetical protein